MRTKILSSTATLAIASVLALAPVSVAQQQQQPEMQSALEHLRQAEQDLQRGSHDKGGHRVKAMELINQAEGEVQAGIAYDNQHLSPGEAGYGGPQAPGEVRITHGPVVEHVDDHSAVISWSSSAQGSSRVEYGTNSGNLTELAESPWGQGGLTHRVQLNNLRPNTTYYYEVETGEARGAGGDAESQRVQSFHTPAR